MNQQSENRVAPRLRMPLRTVYDPTRTNPYLHPPPLTTFYDHTITNPYLHPPLTYESSMYSISSGVVTSDLPTITTPTITTPTITSAKFTLQIVRHNNERGSFNTSIIAPCGSYPTLHSLKTKIDTIAQSHQIDSYVLFYRYGARGTKYVLESDDAFFELNWEDERLIFNIEQIRVGKKRSAAAAIADSGENRPKKPRSKYDQENKKIEDARKILMEQLPQQIQSKMTHRDWIQMSYLHGCKAEQWPVAEIIKKLDKQYKQKNEANTSNEPASSTTPSIISENNNGSNSTPIYILLAIQASLTRLEDRVSKVENQTNQQ